MRLTVTAFKPQAKSDQGLTSLYVENIMLTWVSARGYFSVYRLGSHVEVWRKNYHSYTLLHFLYKRYHKNTEGSTNNTTARCSENFFPRCYIESNSSLLHYRNTMQRNNATESSSQRESATCAKMIVKTTLPCRRVKNGFQFIQWGKGNYKMIRGDSSSRMAGL